MVNRLNHDFGFCIDDVSFDENNDINVHAFYDEQINGVKVPFDFCSSGSGMMQVLQILTSIYRYCPINSSVVLLDEPDAHLHANMQVSLFYSLREIQKELNIQILISTHSTAIISAAIPSEIIPISDLAHIEPLTEAEEVDDIISERIDSYELSKAKVNGVLVFFEDQNIDFFLKCDQVLNSHCLSGPRTVAKLTGRTKDDKLPFSIKPVLKELLNRDISIFVIRDRDGLSSDIVDTVISCADEAEISYHFLRNYEIESYLLNSDLILRVLNKLNPDKQLPTSAQIDEKIRHALKDTIQLTKYRYTSVLEDNLSKLSYFDGLELYRGTNEYRKKAKEIFESYDTLSEQSELCRVGMGKESLKIVMAWINEELKLKISKKALYEGLEEFDIPDEIKEFFNSVKQAIH